jgi:hypothetical protein
MMTMTKTCVKAAIITVCLELVLFWSFMIGYQAAKKDLIRNCINNTKVILDTYTYESNNN